MLLEQTHYPIKGSEKNMLLIALSIVAVVAVIIVINQNNSDLDKEVQVMAKRH